MIITKNFLSLFNPEIKEIDNDKLVEFLFCSGIEVEKLEIIDPPEGIFYGIIKDFLRIKEKSKFKCTVEIPYLKKIVEVVCGANNVRKDMKVVVALPGAILSTMKDPISKKNMYGIESNGMICAYSELYKSDILTNSKSFEGKILDLGEYFDVNKKYSPEDLGLDDVIMDLFIPANRGDLTTAFGLAKEVQKLLGLDPKKFKISNFFDIDCTIGTTPWELKKILFSNNTMDKHSNLSYYLCEFCYKSFGLNKKYFDSPIPIYEVLEEINYSNLPIPSDFSFFGHSININLNELSSFLGISEKQIKEVINYLEKYDYKFENDQIIVPAYRNDLKDQRDFSEEIARFSKFKEYMETHPSLLSLFKKDNRHINNIQKIKEFWRNRGFFECSTFNLTNPEYFPESKYIVQNPQSKYKSVLREHALYELINVIGKNNRRKNILRPVFEVFYSSKWGWLLNIVVPETNNKFVLNETTFSNDLLDLLSLLFKCFEYLDFEFKIGPANLNKKPFHSKNLLQIDAKYRSDRILGYIGYLESCLPFKLWGCMVYLQESRCSSSNHRERLLDPIPSIYPISTRDISIFIPNNFFNLNKPIQWIIRKGRLMYLEILEKYPVKGGNNYLLRCYFQSREKTLTKAEINGYMNEIYEYLKSENIKVN